uniref:DUF834 domain-containing protein n=1 Tax=Oryza punctata TaxID=4537 RepID=A0A0E0LBC0_ORYPU
MEMLDATETSKSKTYEEMNTSVVRATTIVLKGDDDDGGGVAGVFMSEEMTTTEMGRWSARVDSEDRAPMFSEHGEGVDEGELDEAKPATVTVQ